MKIHNRPGDYDYTVTSTLMFQNSLTYYNSHLTLFEDAIIDK